MCEANSLIQYSLVPWEKKIHAVAAVLDGRQLPSTSLTAFLQNQYKPWGVSLRSISRVNFFEKCPTIAYDSVTLSVVKLKILHDGMDRTIVLKKGCCWLVTTKTISQRVKISIISIICETHLIHFFKLSYSFIHCVCVKHPRVSVSYQTHWLSLAGFDPLVFHSKGKCFATGPSAALMSPHLS